jgi:uncharacterized membrane protein
MSDIATTSTLIALSLMLVGCIVGWVCILVGNYRERRREERESQKLWMRLLK